jgi:hypothetical protein
MRGAKTVLIWLEKRTKKSRLPAKVFDVAKQHLFGYKQG